VLAVARHAQLFRVRDETKNMITGAAQMDGAILIVSGADGPYAVLLWDEYSVGSKANTGVDRLWLSLLLLHILRQVDPCAGGAQLPV
jgi:hypothetical protein